MTTNLDNLLSYYNTLLTIGVAVVGIIIAAIFVFIQLVYSRFGYREVKRILLDPFLIGFLLLSILLLIITSLASLSLAIGEHDFIRSIDLNVRAWIVNQNTLLAIWLLLLLTSISFFLLIVTNLKLLQPGNLIYLASKSWNPKHLREFLFKKYGIEEPYMAPNILFTFDDPIYEEVLKEIEDEAKSNPTGANQEQKEKSDARKKLEQEWEEKETEHQKNLASHQNLKESVVHARDPFSDANQVALDALIRVDLRTYTAYLLELEKTFDSFLETIDERGKTSSWNPDRTLPENAIRLLVELYESHVEVINHAGLYSVRKLILESTQRLAQGMASRKQSRAIARLASFWKRMAERYMTTQPEVFKIIVRSFQETAELTLNTEGEGESANELFRGLGWLGEKLFLTPAAIEEQPLMPDDDEQSSQFDDLMNVILGLGDIYTRSHPDWYPLIFFDAVDVVFLRLADTVQTNKLKIRNADTSIFNLLWIYSSFAEEALRTGNTNGAALAAMNLRSSIKKLNELGLEKRRNEGIDLLLWLGAFAAGHKDKYGPTDLLSGKSFDNWVIDELMPYMAGHDISSEMIEILIKGKGERAGVKSFIIKMSDRTGRTFGLNIEGMREQFEEEPKR